MSSVAGNWHTLKLLLASWVVRQQKLATVPHLATMPYYAHLCPDVARSVQQSGATCSWWSTGGWFLTKNDITTVSSVAGNWHTLKLLLASWVVRQQKLASVPHLATMPYYAHLCPDVARSVQQSGATCSWWSTGGWFLTKNDITTVSSVAGNWHTLKLLLASWVVRQQKLATVPHLATMPYYAILCPSMLWRCKECSTVWSHMLMVKHRWMISDKKWYHDSVFSRR